MKKVVSNTLIYLFLIFAAFLSIFPLLIMLRISLLPASKFFETPLDWFALPTWKHYQSVLTEGPYVKYILNSLILSLVSTIVIMVAGTAAAFGIARYPLKKKDNLLFFILGTRMGPPVVFAVPTYLMMVAMKLIDTYIGMVLIYAFSNLAFCIWMMYSFFKDIPQEYEEAAMLDGLGEFGVFLKVSLPQVSEGLIATAILVFTFVWNEFFLSLIMTRSVAKTFPTHIPSFFGAYEIDWGGMFAASILGIIIPIVFGISVRKYLARGLTMGTMK